MTSLEWTCKHIGCHDSILDRAGDPHITNRGHNMSSVTDQKETLAVPPGKTARFNRKQCNISPLLQLVDSVADFGQQCSDYLLQSHETFGMPLLSAPSPHEIGNLPKICMVRCNQQVTFMSTTHPHLWIARSAR